MDTENDVRVKVSAETQAREAVNAALILNTVVIQAATWLIVSEVPPFVHGPVEEEVDLVPPDEADAAPVFLELSPADAFDVPSGARVARVQRERRGRAEQGVEQAVSLGRPDAYCHGVLLIVVIWSAVNPRAARSASVSPRRSMASRSASTATVTCSVVSATGRSTISPAALRISPRHGR
jgi:hypothetical protein